MRIEKDYLGEMEISDEALYGIHAARAYKNFPDTTRFHLEWYKAVGLVKQACHLTVIALKHAIHVKYKNHPEKELRICGNMNLKDEQIFRLLTMAAEEVSEGKHFADFIVPAVSGGAGTSINMNINEIIANVALKFMGLKPGSYQIIDPIEQANIFQSTNDVIPTSLKVAVMLLLQDLEKSINELRFVVEQHETAQQGNLRIGFTQMQEAVPTSFGRLFSTYSEALSRDWWRVSKCFERIKMVNLGGSAIGTGMAVPRFFIMEAIMNLQKITGLPITRSENLADATSNLDSFVEVHATLKAHAVNLEKMVSDLRLLSSDLTNLTTYQPTNLPTYQLILPQVQVGSSIMPGKINPVIPEFVISVSHKIYANDMLISSLSALGCLELNAYLPVIGHAMLDSIRLLIAANNTLMENLFKGLIINHDISQEQLFRSPSITTALIPVIGYHKSSELARFMKSNGKNVFESNAALNLLDDDRLRRLLEPENLLKLGYILSDLDD